MTLTINGTEIARSIRSRVAQRVAETAATGKRPGLATILVGDDPASAVYVAAKRRAIRQAGMRDFHRHLPRHASRGEVAAVIDELAADPDVSGILLQLPLPAQLDAGPLIDRIPVTKDVDGLTTASVGRLARDEKGLRPCTPSGVIELLDAEGIELKGACAAVVGWGALVGRPLAQLLLRRGATVSIAHEFTADLASVTRTADIVVVATGVRGLIGSEHVKSGATVIDVGIHRTPDGLVGDVRAAELDGIAGRITPVPGGVGPMTIAMLLVNTLRAAEWDSARAALSV
ncbi:bifunctional 5,10-methylenetetrahydrofolate dehydrogenase/5,10-methenyltetrahydrofolate cyclohydrolase [Streptomyces nodosus]|uniref:Bifunctional protein FolD n=1 Tax=Streptomyces nodosus TaxID=40318 RepID=A0A0B5D6V7_9ACTN|nr:bifunctional 5,10-methylenetetrahydrofolate dehydrogenase/5,10-methenyltetrahydrofolate cyclohydrolase [Streptomyces nodosus]AJE38819.1 5,10-methylene-tetrahydrofolate cyclohydrolase [Streptomyces nodosus]MBB4789590.1 methylenetetrahydrofolate dehydrogenase (NADP+)/methenyltetrahydrofolate cyclohydrolase [Streptomyces nodosus]QEV43016.1 bifunctional 5,10-methylenetetrahydrofolate dehydrogenase/5,10-methenyltetrahydrofolate cyclohydrolase [Streptomyces nodosus]